MNELDLVRELRADIGAPTDIQLAAGHEQLLAAIGAPGSRQLRRRPPRTRYLGGVLAAAVVAAALVLVLEGSGTSTPLAPGGGTEARVRLASQVLRAAASSLASQPAARPDPHQWIYGSFVARAIGQPAQSNEEWSRFDGRQSAYAQDGQLVVHTSPVPPSGASYPMGAYHALASLPSSPTAVLRAADRTIVATRGSVAPPGGSPIGHHQTRQQLEFQFLTQLLWQAAQAAPARAEAVVFRALATLPGVTAQSGITDAVGRPAIGLSDVGDEQQLLLDPRTYKVTGLRTISDGSWPMNVMARSGPKYPRGTVIESDAWVKIALVSRPGER